ncbi:MAG: metallophosphoesterase [Treponema sp.]|jgi:hypothetical protein|nr:metallophosphoesterase [Treponema sp.]
MLKRFKTLGVLLVLAVFFCMIVGNCDDSKPENGPGNTPGDGPGNEPGTASLSLKCNGATISGTELEVAIIAGPLTFTAVNEKNETIDFTLRSSKTVVATVSGKTITLRGVGETDITATARGDSTRSQSFKLKVVPDTQYNITVINGTADKTKASAGETVTLIPGKQAGKEFSDWTVEPAGVEMLTGKTFTMPAFDVTATANFIDWFPAGRKPYFVTTNYGQDASSELLVQWHNHIQFETQTFQIVKYTGDWAGAQSTEVTGTEFMATNTAPSYIGDYDARNVFRQKITGLEPNTLYKFRMGAEERWSEVFEHKTASVSYTDFSFTVVADSQDASEGQTHMKVTLKAADDYDSDNRFFLHCGDVVEQIGAFPDEIVYYTNAANDFNIKKPIITTQGNHDTYDTRGPTTYSDIKGEATIFNNFMTFPDNGSSVESNPKKSQSYYFYYNKVLFVMLNTLVADAQHTPQANWLKGVLEADRAGNKSLYTIVITHKGPFGNHYYESSDIPRVRAAYGKIFSDFNVDIVFHGHDHTYTRSHPIKITGTTTTDTKLTDIDFSPVTNGTIYSIPGATGKKLYGEAVADQNNPLWKNGYVKRTRTEADVDGGVFVNVKVTAEKLTVTAMRTNERTDENLPDTYEVTKKTY